MSYFAASSGIMAVDEHILFYFSYVLQGSV